MSTPAFRLIRISSCGYQSSVATGFFDYPVTVHGLFSVAAGNNTFFLLAKEFSGSLSAFDMQLTLVFFPTTYGTVDPTLAAPGADNSADTELNQEGVDPAAAKTMDTATMARELANLRSQTEQTEARIAMLEQQLAKLTVTQGGEK